MTVDLHSHYLPVAVVESAAVDVSAAELSDGNYRFAAGGTAMTLTPDLVDLSVQYDRMRQQGIERRILAIPPFCLLYELPVDDGIRWSCAINDGIAAAVQEYPDSFVGFATVPLQDASAAVTELDRAVEELDLRGVEIATNINGVELDAIELEPFWERAEFLKLPVLVHPHYVAGSNRMGDYHLRNLIGNPTETALAGARLLFGGVLERFPELRIILSHGGGVLPHIVGRLRRGYEVRPECRVRASAPIEHLRSLYYDTIVFDSETLRHLVEVVGSSQVVVGSDYPFDMSEDRPINFIQQAGLRDDDVQTILGNGARLLRKR